MPDTFDIVSYCSSSWPGGYKTFFMLNSLEHEIPNPYKDLNANNCWYFNIYEHDKFHAQLSWAWKKVL